MKKNILLTMVAFFIASYFSFAQLMVDTKVSECKTSAETLAKTSGYTSPQLVAIGTIAGNLDFNGVPIEAKITLKTGKATFWLFVYKSAAKPDSAIYIASMKTIIGQFITVPVPADRVKDFEVDLSTSVEGINWMDSDKIYPLVSINNEYKTFMAADTSAAIKMLGLGTAPQSPGSAFWIMMFQAKASFLTCVMDAVTGEVFCVEEQTGVNDNIVANVNVFPNPATEFVSITLPVENQSLDSRMVLTDYSGNFVKELNAPKNGEANVTVLRTNDLTNGVYFIKYTSSKGNFVKAFTVVK